MSTFLSIALASQFSSAQLLEAIGQAETGMNYAAIGDKGESRGAWQISKTVWRKFSAHDWRTYAHRPIYSERVAAQYLEWLRGSFTWDQRRQPTCEDMLCLWQLGFHGYKQKGFDPKRTPSSVRAAIKRLSVALQAGLSPASPTTKTPSVVAGGRASILRRNVAINTSDDGATGPSDKIRDGSHKPGIQVGMMCRGDRSGASISSRPAVLKQRLQVVSSCGASLPRRRVSGPGGI